MSGDVAERVAVRISRRVALALVQDCNVVLDGDALARVRDAVSAELEHSIATPEETRRMVQRAFRPGLRPDDDE